MASSNTFASSATLKAYEDKIKAQVQEAKAKLEQVEATAKAKRADRELTAISDLNATKQNIDRKLQDLKKTHQTYHARAKADINQEVATFKASVNALAGKFTSQPARK